MEKRDFDAFNERNKLSQYAVKISNVRTGSGVLFMPQEGEYAYIFTVAHVVRDFIKNRNFPVFETYFGKSEYKEDELDSCLLYKKNEQGKYDEDVLDDKESYGNSEDVGVFRILKASFPSIASHCIGIEYINEKKINEEFDFGGFGFPNNSESVVQIFGKIRKWKEEEKLFTCENEYITNDFISSMSGYSGTGIFIEKDNHLALAGLIVSCKSNELHNRFKVVGMTDILKKMSEVNWKIPKSEEEYSIPQTFISEGCNCIEIIEKRYAGDTIQKKIKDIFFNIINNFTPKELAENENFHNIPVCLKHREDCSYYWAGKLLLLIYFHCLNINKGDIHNYLWKEDIKVEYICSEGSGMADIGTVVSSIVRSKVLKNIFSSKSIIIWQSSKTPERRILAKRKMSERIDSIFEENFGEACKEGYYLMDGENKKREYGIVHINEFIDRLANMHNDEINMCKLIEVFEEVMKRCMEIDG